MAARWLRVGDFRVLYRPKVKSGFSQSSIRTFHVRSSNLRLFKRSCHIAQCGNLGAVGLLAALLELSL